MSKEFWNSIAKKNKTTGYTDYSIAFFDQIMRLKVIERIINQYVTFNHKEACLLDFGCGTGDFISYFSHKFQFIVGYDISEEILKIAQQRCKNVSNISLTNSLEKINGKFDIVLSITVLQHILDDNELLKTLILISNKCKENAIFIVLESIKNSKFNISQPPWVKARRLEDWKFFLEKSGFEILFVKSFYNPFLIKTSSYFEYRKKVIFFVYIYKLFRRFGFNFKLFNSIFKRQAEAVLNKERNIDGLLEEESISKIFIAKKRSPNNEM